MPIVAAVSRRIKLAISKSSPVKEVGVWRPLRENALADIAWKGECGGFPSAKDSFQMAGEGQESLTSRLGGDMSSNDIEDDKSWL